VGSIPASRTKKRKACNCGCRLFYWQDGICYLKVCMNKAFTKETDSDDDDDDVSAPAGGATGKNYITPGGYSRLRDELLGLMDVERPKVVESVYWAASNGDRSENGDYIYGKKRLREIDRRIRFLTQRLEIAEVTDPSVHFGSQQIFFGATVTYEDDLLATRTVTILGVDEADTLKGEISWVSPVAKAMLGTSLGDDLSLEMPGGKRLLSICAVSYPQPKTGLSAKKSG
jgi:transcription elongation factor GreB